MTIEDQRARVESAIREVTKEADPGSDDFARKLVEALEKADLIARPWEEPVDVYRLIDADGEKVAQDQGPEQLYERAFLEGLTLQRRWADRDAGTFSWKNYERDPFADYQKIDRSGLEKLTQEPFSWGDER